MNLFNSLGQLSASQLKQIAEMVADRIQLPWQSAPVLPGGAVGGYGQSITPEVPSFLAEITSRLSTGGYGFQEVKEVLGGSSGNGVFSPVNSGFNDGGGLFPAYEENGSTSIVSGTIVRLRASIKGDHYLFAAPGSSAGGGGDLIPSSRILFSGARTLTHSNQPCTSNVGVVPVVFPGVQFDTDSYWNVANPTRLTAPATGYYLIGGQVSFDLPPALNIIYTSIIINLNSVGELSRIVYNLNPPDVLAEFQTMQISTLWKPTAGDYVEMAVLAQGGLGTYRLNAGGGFFWIARLGT